MSVLNKINVIGVVGLAVVWAVIALTASTIAFSRLSVETNQGMQPFGKSAEDELTEAQVLQPTVLGNELQHMRHHMFLQGSR